MLCGAYLLLTHHPDLQRLAQDEVKHTPQYAKFITRLRRHAPTVSSIRNEAFHGPKITVKTNVLLACLQKENELAIEHALKAVTQQECKSLFGIQLLEFCFQRSSEV